MFFKHFTLYFFQSYRDSAKFLVSLLYEYHYRWSIFYSQKKENIKNQKKKSIIKIMEIKLYPWQEDCLKAWKENNCRGIINVVTGAGKTFLALSAIREVFDGNLRIKIVVPTISLLFQWKKEIIQFFGKEYEDEIALFYGGSKGKEKAIFSIYVVNSARHIISKAIINDIKRGQKVMFIADETHRYLSKENKKIFHYLLSKEFKKEMFYSLALSATVDGEGLKEILQPALGEVIYTLDHKEALDDKVISPFVIFETSINFASNEREEYINLTYSIEVLYKKIIKKYSQLKYIADYRDLMKTLNVLAKEDEEVDIYLKLLFKKYNCIRNILCVLLSGA